MFEGLRVWRFGRRFFLVREEEWNPHHHAKIHQQNPLHKGILKDREGAPT